jgi:hypothetical protein
MAEPAIRFRVNGREIEAADELTIRDAFEAERYLGVDPQSASAVQSLAVLMFAGLRKAEPSLAPEEAAEAILSVNLGNELTVEGGNGDRPPTRLSATKSSGRSTSASKPSSRTSPTGS